MPTLPHIRAGLAMLLLLFAARVAAQQPFIKHFSAKDGLPSTTVYGLLNDSKGFLWICTDVGVSRFDGHKFTNFSIADGLSDNEMLRVYEDSKGRVWLLGLNGTLSYYYNGSFFNPTNDSVLKKAQVTNSYCHMFEDNRQRLWFSSFAGYTLIDKNKVSIIDTGLGHSRGIVMNFNVEGTAVLSPSLPSSYRIGLYVFRNEIWQRQDLKFYNEIIASPCHLADGTVLFVAKEGVIRQKDSLQQLLFPLDDELRYTDIVGLFVSQSNELWVTTLKKGIFCYDFLNLKLPPKKYLPGKNTVDIAEDQEHNIWVSTLGDGIFMLPPGYKTVKNYRFGPNSNLPVYAVAKDQYGNIYTGHDGGAVNITAHGQSKAFDFKKMTQLNTTNKIVKILIAKNELWIAGMGSISHIHMKNGQTDLVRMAGLSAITKKYIFSLVANVKDLCFSNGHFFVATGYAVFVPGTGSNDTLSRVDDGKRTYCIYCRKDGILWYGGIGGLNSYDGKTLYSHASESAYLNGRINSIKELPDSVLVLATYGYGILLYKNGKITSHITEENGLASNICRQVFVYGNDIFVATPNGASRIYCRNGKIDSIKKYTMAEGLLSNDVNDVCADDSEMCFATSEGLSVLSTSDVPVVCNPPPIYITNIKCKDSSLQLSGHYAFEYYRNSLQFSFTGISFGFPGDIVYQYRLTDDQPWQETKNPSVDFPFLAPGAYRFQLRAKVLNGPWSDVKSFGFTISPPFWKTTGFIFFVALSFIGLVLFAARRQALAAQRKERERQKIKDQVTYLEQKALQAMMNPHFIFNVMNSIQNYINNNETHEANLFLSDFAKLIRMNLDISSRKYISLDEEVAYLHLYLSLEARRFKEQMTYAINMDSSIDGDDTLVPVMLVQPFIENAIWHGILPKQQPGHVQVDIARAPGGLIKIEVTDNGVGVKSQAGRTNTKKHTGKGMKMTEERLSLISKICNRNLQIKISEAFPGEAFPGVKVAFMLPGDLE